MGAEEMMTIPLVISITVIVLLFSFYLIGQFNQKLTPMYDKLDLPSQDNETYQNFSSQMTVGLRTIDAMMPFAYVLLLVVMALLAFQLRTHPAFIPIMILAGIGGIFIANTFQTIVTEFESTASLSTVSTVTDIPYSTFIMSNLPKLTVVGFVIILIAFFSRGSSGSGGWKE